MGCPKLQYYNYLTSEKSVINARSSYIFSFNGKENDDETETQDYGMRIYDYRLGKFLSVDPLTKSYPWYTPYQFAGNNSIRFIDLDGGEPKDPPGMFLNNPNSKNYQDHYQNGGNLTRVYDISTVKKYWVHQQNAVNGGVSFYWYNEQALKWQPFTPNGYADNGNWQDGEYGIGNYEKFQNTIRSYSRSFKVATGFGYAVANFSIGGIGMLSRVGAVSIFIDRAASGLSDMGVQLACGKKFDKDYNYTSTLANTILPNSPLISSAIGSFGEVTFEANGFVLGKTKTFGKAIFETCIGTFCNIGGSKVANYGINLDKSISEYEQFGLKLLGGAVGNSTSAAVTSVN